MIQPEDDFRTWIQIVSSIVESPIDFEAFLPGIKRLLDSVQSTSQLPEPIKQHTEEFLTRLPMETMKLLCLYGPDEDARPVVESYLKMIISFSCWGITKQPHSVAISRYTSAIVTADCRLFDGWHQLREILCRFVRECGYYELAKAALKSGVESIDLLLVYYQVLVTVVEFFPDDTSFSDFTDDMLTCLTGLCKADLRKVSHFEIRALFDIGHRFLAGNPNHFQPTFVTKWLDIFAMCLESEFFEKKLLGYRSVQDLVAVNNFKPAAADWLRSGDHVKLFSGVSLREQFMGPFTAIVSFMGSAALLTKEYLTNLWQLHSVQHDSIIELFFGIFAEMARTLSSALLPDLVELALHPNAVSHAWVKFLGRLATVLGGRQDALESFSRIR
jgi:hypothetical protein